MICEQILLPLNPATLIRKNLLLSSHGTNFDWVGKEEYSHQNIIIYCSNLTSIHFFVSCGKAWKQSNLVSHTLRTTEFIDDWGWYGGNDDRNVIQTFLYLCSAL